MTHENRFGLFVHWGVYALTGLHEQAQAREDIDHETYGKLAKDFNPVDYDPEQWVLLAKKAGMRYICFTAKHHDGFCMWDTKETDFNIMNTRYGKDVLKMLADACHKHGLLLSIYYSNPDWNHPYGYNPNSSHQWKARNMDAPDTEKYREFVKAQVKELLTNYGPIYTFFWDIPPHIEDPSINELVRSLQPNIYINDRGWSEGDFATPEREVPAAGSKRYTRMTEACNSVGLKSWGYRTNEDFYTKRFLCCAIDRYMAMGASYLLNVGPDATGKIPQNYQDRLMQVANWYNRMEGTLESHQEDTFAYEIPNDPYVAVTKNGKTYLHFYEGLIARGVSLRKYPGEPKAVRLMNTGKPLPFGLEYMPDCFNWATNVADRSVKRLHIFDIDVDALSDEPIVLEITW